MANKPLNPRCLHNPDRKYVRGCKCPSCLACVAENKLNKQLRDERRAELRETLRNAGHPLYADKPAAPTKPVELTYDPASPISIFNHPPFPSMTLRQTRELGESWP